MCNLKSHFILGTCCFLVLAGFAPKAHAQLILNGSFENTTATGTVFNPSNAVFNSLMSNVTAFGVREGTDIQTFGSGFGQAPQQGNWKISPASDLNGNTEAFSMTLSSALDAGSTYHLSFAIERLQSGSFNGGTVLIGLSTSATNFGTQVATATAPSSGWLIFDTDFLAPNAGGFLTVQLTNTQDSWVGLDNFQLSAVAVPEPMTWALMGMALTGAGGWSYLRRRRKRFGKSRVR